MADLDLPRTWGGKLKTAITAINDEVETLSSGGSGDGDPVVLHLGSNDSTKYYGQFADHWDGNNLVLTVPISGFPGLPSGFTEGEGNFVDEWWDADQAGLYRIALKVEVFLTPNGGAQTAWTGEEGYLVLAAEVSDDDFNGRTQETHSGGTAGRLEALMSIGSGAHLKLMVSLILYDPDAYEAIDMGDVWLTVQPLLYAAAEF